jgi:hypothetical protein
MKSESLFLILLHTELIAGLHRYYYQYQESRLSTCVLTIHGLLHIPNDIRAAAPTWATWTFYIERFCGILQRGLHSRRNPAENMDKRVLHMAYLSQLGVKYDLDEELSAIEDRRSDEIKRGESVLEGCMFLELSFTIIPNQFTKTQIMCYGHLGSKTTDPVQVFTKELSNTSAISLVTDTM